MISVTKRWDRLAESGIEYRTKDAGTGEVVFERCVGVSRREPERIGESGHCDAVSAEQIHIILLRLGNPTLTAGYHANLTSIPFHIERVIIIVVLISHPQQNVGVADCLRCLERKHVALFIDVAK